MYCLDPQAGLVRIFTLEGNPSVPSEVGTNLNNPKGIAVDTEGNVYITDTGNNRIVAWRLEDSSQQVVVPAQGESASGGDLNAPEGIAVDDYGNIFVADTGNNEIKKYDGNGNYITKIGGIAVSSPTDIALNRRGIKTLNVLTNAPHGTMYIADTGNNRIVILYDFVSPCFYDPPIATITYPPKGKIITLDEMQEQDNSKIINVQGGVRAQTLYNSWNFSYGSGISPSDWITINQNTENLDYGILGNWDVTAVDEGVYTLKLTLPYTSNILGVESLKTEEHTVPVILSDWTRFTDTLEPESYFWINEIPEVTNYPWQTGNASGANGNWQITTEDSSSPSRSYKANIVNNTDCWLVSPMIDLTDATESSLEFMQKYNFPYTVVSGVPQVDPYGYIEVSKDNGATWEKLLGLDGGYIGTTNGWQRERYDISKYAGNKIKVRFHTRATNPNGSYWYIDDVKILPQSVDITELPEKTINNFWMDKFREYMRKQMESIQNR